jgi:acyl carrier protein
MGKCSIEKSIKSILNFLNILGMKVTVEEVIEVLKHEVEARIDYDTLKTDLSLREQGMDSLDSLTFYLAVEEKFGVKIDEDETDKLKSIDDIIGFVNKE